MSEIDCTRCTAASSRRDFLLGALALGASALAFPVNFASALSGDGQLLSYALPAADGATIDKKEGVILVRWQNTIYAFALSCPHQNNALRWQAKDQRFQCPKHKSKYQPDGTFISGRATRGMDRFPVKVAENTVQVEKRLIKQTDDHAAWDAAFARIEA